MCLTPIPIDNPYYQSRSPTIRLLKDTHLSKLMVPCGHCSVCLRLKQAYFVQRVQCEAIDHDIWSCMLSYNNKYLPTIEVNGYKHKYADMHDIQLLIQRLKKRDDFPPFHYFAVSEFGHERHRPHWHLLFFTPKIPNESQASLYSREHTYWKAVLSEWYCNLGSKRKPVKDPLLTYRCQANGKRNYDFRYVDPHLSDTAQDDTSFYCSKYLVKYSDYVKNLKSALYLNLSEADFTYYWNIIRPKTGRTIGFGDIKNPKVITYLNDCVDFSLRHQFPFPVFINPNTGQTFPMSPYLYKKVSNFETELAFRKNRDHLYIDGTNVSNNEDVDLETIERRESEFKRMLDKINKRDIGDFITTQVSTDNDLLTINNDDYELYLNALKACHSFDFSHSDNEFD